ncbi:hypothetical protein CsatB_010365 [Cannabis sativa]
MGTNEWKSDNDCWILEPIHIISTHRQYSKAETVSPSPVVTSSSESWRLFGLRGYLDKGKLWKRLRCCFTCCLGMPLTSYHGREQDEDRVIKSGRRIRIFSKNNKKKKRVEAEWSSCCKNCCCCCLEEHEEKIKAAICYCKDTLSSTSSPTSITVPFYKAN